MTTENLDDLLDKLKNGSTPARYTAANKLGKLGDPAAVDPLMDALDDPDDKVRDNVIFALGELEAAKAAPRLVKLLIKEKGGRIRKSAAKALGLMRTPGAVDALVAALSDEDFRVRKSAARSLGMIGDKKALKALQGALADPNFTVTKYVEEAIERIKGS